MDWNKNEWTLKRRRSRRKTKHSVGVEEAKLKTNDTHFVDWMVSLNELTQAKRIRLDEEKRGRRKVKNATFQLNTH